MKFLIDECLDPKLAQQAHREGHEATSVRDLNRCGSKDWQIAQYVTENNFVLVTHNAKDFRDHNGKPGYLTKQDLHPGLICLSSLSCPMTPGLQGALFAEALAHLGKEGIQDLMNQVLELDLLDEENVDIRLYEAPARPTGQC
jgi:hypothetical protein